ncbi:MAG TPA: DNA-3-methyladenine glycosylase 2 family protein [Streptosporangiaceae bacterium]|nr:DNA-3-methyladenine glycosylase 2 family protein [Streptosporangiaceae bacterium]
MRAELAQAGHPEQSRAWDLAFPVNVQLVLGVHRRGPHDPAYRADVSGAIWRASLTPDGPATLRVAAGGAELEPAGRREVPPALPGDEAAGSRVTATAWGPGAGWALDRLPDLLGACDDPAAFVPAHPRLRELAARYPGLRLGRTGRVLEALVPAVLEQKVVGIEAARAWRRLLTWYGTPAPGPAPAGMRVFPPAATWLAIPSWDWHRAGVEGIRAATIRGAALVASSLEEICACPPAEADSRLRSLPGIGPWTSAEVRQRACGDPDAVSVGDYHLPAQVGWALAGRPADDDGMLALLAPYAGQRHRAARLIEIGGGGPPRRGPRMPARDYRAF